MSIIKPRHFNSITIFGNQIRKESIQNPGKIRSEYRYISKVNELIPGLFPNVSNATDSSYMIEYVDGSTMSDLYIGGNMNIQMLLDIVDGLTRLHDYDLENTNNIFYTNKLEQRREQIFKNEASLFVNIYDDIIKQLKMHEPFRSHVIHGDPVLTNILYDGKIHFIDPRGEWDGVDTIYGNIYYDYAKLLQSLEGYDAILNNVSITPLFN
jgi:tRNA A-37 threonylcarbamoyl transferase component Bud32